jgi:hypothetical protein
VYFDVAGDLAPSDLQRVAESLHPATGSYPAPTEHKTAAAVVLVAGTALAAVVALLWVARLRRKTLRRPSIKGVGWLPLIGAAVVVLGTGLHWHAMLGSGHNATFAVTGWHEPLALATVGVALAAAAAAACLPLVARRLSTALRATAIALASLAVAAAVLGVFYLPVQARFVVQTAPQLGDFFDRYFANPASPSAGPGLYVSILGCVVLLIGAILAGRPRADGKTG